MLMRNGHIQAVEEFFGLSEEEATVKAHALFSERKHLFQGFELWDHARFLTRHPGPGVDDPLRDDRSGYLRPEQCYAGREAPLF